jgi:DNA-binding transcriptional regulator YiaG
MTADDFRTIRQALGHSQVSWAKALGISERQVKRIESGEQGVTKTVALLVGAIQQGYRPKRI